MLSYAHGGSATPLIGETIGAPVPQRLQERVADGALGRKSRRGFYDYD